jgi:hypothetical protein
MRFATSIDKVEQMTGIDFFWGLEDRFENEAEIQSFRD